MRITAEAFPKVKYIGPTEEGLGLTKGNEYHRISEGLYWWGNVYGVWVTSDHYHGTDIDYCTFLSLENFNRQFEDKMPTKNTPNFKNRRKIDMKHKKRKIRIQRDKHGSDYVNEMIAEGNQGKLFRNERYVCTCSWCQLGRQAKHRRNMEKLDYAELDYERETYYYLYEDILSYRRDDDENEEYFHHEYPMSYLIRGYGDEEVEEMSEEEMYGDEISQDDFDFYTYNYEIPLD